MSRNGGEEWNGMEFHGTSTTKVISGQTICNDIKL